MQIEQTVSFTMPRNTAARLGYYVYLYLDPVTDAPLYVGKGKGDRILAHLSADGDCEKGRAMRRLRESGKQPRLRFVRHGLSEKEARLVESSLIDVLRLGKLVNKVPGQGSRSRGSMSFEQLRVTFATQPIEIADPLIMVRISRSFRYDMTPLELFEATCGTWKIGARKDEVRYALAVHDDVVHQVYAISGWQHSGTRHYETRDVGGVDASRWEFSGWAVGDGDVRDRYLHRNVSALFNKSSQNPIRYAFPTSVVGQDSVESCNSP